MTFVIGLTGSIGMGKTTTARMFADQGAAVWNADDAVHRLYAKGGEGVTAVAALCPDAVTDGAVDRAILSAWVQADPAHLARLEAAVHPLVAEDRARFLGDVASDIAVLDIPLLFETDATNCDLAVVVSAPRAVQRARVLERGGMTPEKLALILSRQMPDAEKRARADVIIDTSSLDTAGQAVRLLMRDIRGGRYARNRSRH